ncbi:SWF or SNF family helicase [Streptomyces sp. WMMB303]|uniref:SWIM zinc finger family protein n=1 Tax=Streptomyces sp. WMMB303 TaxID=3034154 RepID=UPI0023ED3EBF|nr:SWF or SNF family helicase [Streptomyces sp. WMMB303]MDF4252118.1 SWF or SNF family helicase [Streptomyces sp. WMMB303]
MTGGDEQAHTVAEAENGGEGRERVFAPLPPARGRAFARTWWGRTWLKALEDTALDGAQLKLGRTFARRSAVGAVAVRPGRITAVVLGADRTPCRADVLLRELTADEWDRLLDVVVAQSGHIAALLDRDMPPRLVEDAAEAGLDLLPGVGDLDPECACGGWDHCAHTAALSYQTARLLDEDPLALLLMRGRGERELLETLQERSAAQAAEKGGRPPAAAAREEDGPEGVDAAEAFALGVLLPPLPEPPAPSGGAVGAAALDGAADVPGLDVGALSFLAADAAVTARRMLAEAVSPQGPGRPVQGSLTAREDAVRLAAASPGPAVTVRLAAFCGCSEAELEIAVRAWGFGGAEALSVLADRPGPPAALRQARDELDLAWGEEEIPPVLQGEGRRWTEVGGEAQLRYGPDGRWWPFRRRGQAWWPVGGPERDPAIALAAALAEDGESQAGA